MVEDLAASYIALKLENEILQAQVQRLMEENAALQAQIPELQKPQAAKEDESVQKPTEAQEPPKPSEPLETPAAWDHTNPPEFEEPQKPREPQSLPIVHGLSAACVSQKPPEAKELEKFPMALEVHKPFEVKETECGTNEQPVAEHGGLRLWRDDAAVPPDAHTYCRRPVLVLIAQRHQRVQAAAAGPSHLSGLLHLPLLLRGDGGWQLPLTPTASDGPTHICSWCQSCHSHPLPVPGTGADRSAPSAGASSGCQP
ncbi:Zinc finger CCHC domain-containing protein 5 [Myotis davidii]|uniref:Zinc finger CCHC domain-containing protein 5 n=1 Tax=Myotis davidii TaxID=225400 RepID=L5MBD9_MYODS|nr:Zinc finger CCHC domain-containing protein 5 [Myotis davidii]